MKPRMHLVETSIFSIDNVNLNYEQPPQTSQNSDFQRPFLVLKIDRIFAKKFCEEFWTR